LCNYDGLLQLATFLHGAHCVLSLSASISSQISAYQKDAFKSIQLEIFLGQNRNGTLEIWEFQEKNKKWVDLEAIKTFFLSLQETEKP
jgi:hypothetical protein